VVRSGRSVCAIEVKSGRPRDMASGMSALAAARRITRTLLVGGDGISLEAFLTKSVEHWVKE